MHTRDIVDKLGFCYEHRKDVRACSHCLTSEGMKEYGFIGGWYLIMGNIEMKKGNRRWEGTFMYMRRPGSPSNIFEEMVIYRDIRAI